MKDEATVDLECLTLVVLESWRGLDRMVSHESRRTCDATGETPSLAL